MSFEQSIFDNMDKANTFDVFIRIATLPGDKTTVGAVLLLHFFLKENAIFWRSDFFPAGNIFTTILIFLLQL